MRQIDAEGERTSKLRMSWSSNGWAFDSVEALVPRACGETGGWHNRLYNRLRDSTTGVRSSICVHLFNLWIFEAKLR